MPQFLDVGELACLEFVLGNRASPDQKADTNNEQGDGRFYESLQVAVKSKAQACKEKHRYGADAGEGPNESGRARGHSGVLRLDSSSDFGWEC